METFLIKTVQLLLSLSILVIFHEFGHFIFARMFKVRVEKFYLFFDPWFSLFKFKPKNSYTEYGIGWLPFGGYVKISGMIDESMDREQMSQPPKPWEFRSKPAWQRLLIMVAGVVFNFILAVFIYSMIVYTWGTSYIPFKNAYAGMEYCESARNIGFQNGDIPLSADGVDLNYMSSETLQKIVDAKEVKVLRDNDTITIEIPKNFMLRLIDKEELFALYRIPSVVFEASPNTGAARAGLQKGDHIESIDGEKASSLNEMTKYVIGTMAADEIQLTPSMKGERAMLHYLNGNSVENRRKVNDEIVNCTVEDIRKLAPLLQSVIDHSSICVMGNEEKIHQDADVFDKILSLPD